MATRVPVETLVDWLQGGDTIDGFPENYPFVRREQGMAALEVLREVLLRREGPAGRGCAAPATARAGWA